MYTAIDMLASSSPSQATENDNKQRNSKDSETKDPSPQGGAKFCATLVNARGAAHEQVMLVVRDESMLLRAMTSKMEVTIHAALGERGGF